MLTKLAKASGFLFIFSFVLVSCTRKPVYDLLLYNGFIITLDSSENSFEAIAIHEGKIVALGKNEVLRSKYMFNDEADLEGHYVYPGFHDAHAHFWGLAKTMNTVDLRGAKSWEGCIQRVVTFNEKRKDKKAWITGRGWDQNLWQSPQMPDKQLLLDSLFPETPVFLKRIDGHAAIANQKALDLAGVNATTQVSGGLIEHKADGKVIRLTGVLVDNAVDLVYAVVPEPMRDEKISLLLEAEKFCLNQGLTAITDAGLDKEIILLIDSLQKVGALKIRINAMASPTQENLDWLLKKGKYVTDRLRVNSFKVYMDGALGSRGALLLQPYHDENTYGLLLNSPQYFDSMASVLYQKDFQLCVHAIGDSANRLALQIFSRYLPENNDRRWRIEHAQVVHPDDVKLYSKYKVIPSVQPTHATSDGSWAVKRLGENRIRYSYANKNLLNTNAYIPLGTDFPVEEVNPMGTFMASVFRQNLSFWPDGGYFPDQALSPVETLKGMTIWAAKAAFWENEIGSIEIGKQADFTIYKYNLLQPDKQSLPALKPISVWVAGEPLK